VLHLTGEGAWEVHEASTFEFDKPAATAQAREPVLKVAVAG
jgi:hypothetical protein